MHLSFLGKEATEAAEATVGLGGGASRLGGRLGLGDSVDLVEDGVGLEQLLFLVQATDDPVEGPLLFLRPRPYRGGAFGCSWCYYY